MGTTEDLAFMLALAVGAVCGALAGRPFAVEGENRRTSILAAAYCGAGAGVLSAPLAVFAVVLVSRLLFAAGDGTLAAFVAAGETVGQALLWGIVGGAGGGLAIGLLIAVFKRYAPR